MVCTMHTHSKNSEDADIVAQTAVVVFAAAAAAAAACFGRLCFMCGGEGGRAGGRGGLTVGGHSGGRGLAA